LQRTVIDVATLSLASKRDSLYPINATSAAAIRPPSARLPPACRPPVAQLFD